MMAGIPMQGTRASLSSVWKNKRQKGFGRTDELLRRGAFVCPDEYTAALCLCRLILFAALQMSLD